jgi:hypothetical protein
MILWHTIYANRIQPNNITIGSSRRNRRVFQNITVLLAIVIIRRATDFFINYHE